MLSREGRPARIPPDVSCLAAASALRFPCCRHQCARRGPMEDPFRWFQTKSGSFFAKRCKRSLRLYSSQQRRLPAAARQLTSFALPSRESWRLQFRVKTVVDSAAAIIMYERSLRADHILRGVSWSRSSNSHLQLDLWAVTLKYEITVCTCEADLTFKGAAGAVSS